MGTLPPGGIHNRDRIRHELSRPVAQRPTRPPVTVADLERWADHGAVWRTLECGTDLAVIELCTCYGEPVDVVESHEPELIHYVRSRGASDGA